MYLHLAINVKYGIGENLRNLKMIEDWDSIVGFVRKVYFAGARHSLFHIILLNRVRWILFQRSETGMFCVLYYFIELRTIRFSSCRKKKCASVVYLYNERNFRGNLIVRILGNCEISKPTFPAPSHEEDPIRTSIWSRKNFQISKFRLPNVDRALTTFGISNFEFSLIKKIPMNYTVPELRSSNANEIITNFTDTRAYIRLRICTYLYLII